MPRKHLKVAAVQMLAGEDIEQNAKKVVSHLSKLGQSGVDVAAFH